MWAVALSILSAFVMFALQALRWHLVMKPLVGLRYGQAYRAQLVGMLFNAFLPARGGDFLRVQYLGRRTGKSRAAILGTEVVDRWLDAWGWLPVIVALGLGGGLPGWIVKPIAIFGGTVAAWAVVMLVLTRRGSAPRPGSRKGAVYAAVLTGMRQPNPYGGDEVIDISVKGMAEAIDFQSEMKRILQHGPDQPS